MVFLPLELPSLTEVDLTTLVYAYVIVLYHLNVNVI